MRLRKYTSAYQSLSTSVFVLLIWATMAAQVTSAKPPNPNITAPEPQRHEPAGGKRPTGNSPSIANAPPPNTALTAPYPGDVEGFVYWDANKITHKPAGTCDGLAVNVAPAGSPTKTIPAGYHFKYAGQVKAFLSGGNIQVFDVCIYAYDHQPVGPQLQAQLIITDRNAFSQAATSQPVTVAPITIINGQCNMLPPIVPSSVGDLTAHWGSCQNRAYDVNFAVTPALQVMSSGGGSGGMLSSANKGAANPGPIQSSSRGMLGSVNPGPQQSPSPGMLAGRDPGPIQSPSNGTQAKLLSPKIGAPTLTNADVIGLLKGGVPESAIVNQINSSNKKFDFSPLGCQALAQAKVSPKIIDAMGDGSVRPCFTGGVRSEAGNGADDLNPQPFPPKGSQVFRSASSFPIINSSPAQVLSAHSSQSGVTPTNTRVRVTASSNTGEISGFIYWDPTKTKFPSTCEKVEVRASLDHGSWDSWQGNSGNLTYSSNGSLTVCAYTITGAPSGIPLDIDAEVGWPYMAFGVNLWSLASPGNKSGGAVAWGGEILGEYDVITIQKTSCDVSVTSKMSSSQSNLESGPRSCGNQAVNVNLILSSNPPPLNGSNTTGSNPGSRLRSAQTVQTEPHTNF